ncbi:MarR family transcriptional regulator [Streptosporangium sp. NPDC051022]|uniref:MarR family transcriptional regulator n=1 Tax=Streptosporangium sp. NPDC051022 TaxID=3155752 RepID=UPI0034167C13
MTEHQAGRMDGVDLDAVTSAVLTGSRLLVAIATRSPSSVEDRVTLPRFRMLVVLAGHGETKLVTMAEPLNVNPSTAMRMADRLAASNLIVRRTSPSNRRESLMCLTSAGRRLVDEATALRTPPRVVVDAQNLTFCDSTGLSVLTAALNTIEAAAGQPVIGGTHHRLARILKITGSDRRLRLHPTVESAVEHLTAIEK